MMFHPATTAPMQRAVLGELGRRACRHRGQWVVGLAGVLLPGLRGSPAGRTPDCSASAADFGTTMLASLLQQLDASGVPSEEVAEGLLWTVVRSPDEPALDAVIGPVWLSWGLPCNSVLTCRSGRRRWQRRRSEDVC